jgi:hypothetical protein
VKTQLQRLSLVVAACALSVAIDGCVATGGGYDGGVGVSAGFYEPYGYDYGGWGTGYFVGPGYGGGRRGDRGGSHPYRPAAAGRSTPSIPSRPRGGGGGAIRSGGGGGGGGGAGGGRR